MNNEKGNGMNEEQWISIYQMIKKFIQANQGVPDNNTAAVVLKLYEFVMKKTQKSRSNDPKMDEQITTIFDYLVIVIHCAEKVNKPL